MTKTLVSIDWDYFVTADPQWDLGHDECLLFLDAVWATRGHLIDRMVTTGEERLFWVSLRETMLGIRDWIPLHVSESHLDAYHLAHDARYLVLFDAHHDAWATGGDTVLACDNWVRLWLEGDSDRHVLWVKPSSSHYEPPEAVSDRIDVVSGVDAFKLQVTGLKVDNIHVCRSGCWCPPWLDRAFEAFVRGSGLEYHVMVSGVWDPLRDRWTPEMRAAATAFQAAYQHLL